MVELGVVEMVYRLMMDEYQDRSIVEEAINLSIAILLGGN